MAKVIDREIAALEVLQRLVQILCHVVSIEILLNRLDTGASYCSDFI